MRFFKRSKAVAIDGPAGSGKSTVSRLVAEKLGFTYIDTGAMYRALTLKVMQAGCGFDNTDGMIRLSSKLDIELLPSEKKGVTIRVILDGRDVSEDIRTLEVSHNVKHVAKIAEVRKNLVKLQRGMVRALDGAVMEGRDIGTVVLRDACCKIYLDASFGERVGRRLAELNAKGKPATREEVEDDLKQRDHTDKTRKAGPLKKASDAHLVDTTDLSINQVVAKIVDIVTGKTCS